MLPIKTVFLHVTKACNLRCTYCYFSADRPMPGELTTEDYEPLWADLATVGPRKVVFTGGEPLIRRDLFDLLLACRRATRAHRTRIALNTNGHLVDREVAERLVGVADEVRVSLDGAAVVNDAMRGRGNYLAARRALDTFHDAGFEPKVMITVTTANLDSLPAFLCELVEAGFARISLNMFRLVGRGVDNERWRITETDVRRVLAEVRRRLLPGAADLAEPRSNCQSHCGAGRFINILPNGDIYPCHALTDPRFACGSVRTGGLAQVCAVPGPLSRLASLDYRVIAAEYPPLAALANSGTCLGEMHDQTRDLQFWKRL